MERQEKYNKSKDTPEKTPKNRHNDQLESAQPDEKRSGDPDLVQFIGFGVTECREEEQDIGDKEIVDPGQKCLACKS